MQDDEDRFFNPPFSREDVGLAFNKFKRRKSAGRDGIIGEMGECAGDSVVDFRLQLLNVLFDGMFPDGWTDSIILPLFKKGPVNDPNNYRGIV